MAAIEVPESLDLDYTRYTNRQLVAIPLVVLALALLVIAGWYVLTGAPVTPGIEFTGGTELQIQTDASAAEVEQAFGSLPYTVESVQQGSVRGGEAFYIVTFQVSQSGQVDEITATARDAGFTVESVESFSPTFGGDSVVQALIGLVVAFAGMGLLVFALFRTFVPSIAVILSAFSDIMIPIALMNLLGIELSLGTVAALLMLIGYSVDSDLLLNNHVLRRSGGFYESTYRARRTGVTMTLTSIAAVTVMTIVSTLFGIPLLPDIGIVLVFGLCADLMNTYLLNVSLLRYYKYEGVAA